MWARSASMAARVGGWGSMWCGGLGSGSLLLLLVGKGLVLRVRDGGGEMDARRDRGGVVLCGGIACL